MSYLENQDGSGVEAVKKSINSRDVEIVAQKAKNDPSIQVVNYNVSLYSSKVLGGLGSHWNLEITVQSKKERGPEKLNFFLKHVPLNCQPSLAEFLKESLVFEEETFFFKEIYPLLTENYRGENWSPTCYLIKNDSLIMEDLRLRGYKLQARFFDETSHLKSTLATVARFHSCTILAENRLGKPVNKQFVNSFKEKAYAKTGFPRSWHVSSMDVVAAVAESLNKDSNKLRKTFELIYDMVKPSSKHRNVICHSDLWPNNLMFDDTTKCILVDFQTIRYAPPVLDILQFLYLNTTRAYREANEAHLIEYYYSVLKDSVEKNDETSIIKVLTLEEVKEAYEEFRLFGVVAPCLYFPIHLLNPEIAKEKPVGNSEKLTDFVTGDRVNVTIAGMKKDAWFKNKIEEVVVQFSDYCDKYADISKSQDLDFSKDNIISLQDVKDVAKKIMNDSKTEVIAYSLSDYSSEPLGYFGSHWQLNIDVRKNHGKDVENLSLFVKSLPVDNESHTNFVKESGVFEEESFFFDKMLPQLTENYNGARLAPSCFLAKKNAIVLEDLRNLGFVQHNNIEDFELMRSTLATVARFHSCSILTEARLSRNSKKNIRLDEYFPNAFTEKTYSRTVKTWRYLNAGFKAVTAVAERLGYNPKKIYNTCDQIFEMVQPSKVHRNVICHGDLWANNLMFDDVKQCLMLDFQFIRYMPLVLDILHLLYKNASKSFREKHEKELIEFYHAVLEETIKSNDTGVEIPTLQQVFAAYEDLRLFGVILASLHFPMALLDPKISAEKTKTSEGYEEFIFGDRTEVTLAYMEKNGQYKTIVEEVVNELAHVTDML